MPRLRLVDLFAGCGGLTRGFLDVNSDPSVPVEYETVAAVEYDRSAAATYAANFGRDHLFAGRIEDWRTEDIPDADVVVGGPPCQGFSTLGKQDPSDDRNRLWREYARTVEKIQPDHFVIENVAAFYKSPQWPLLQDAVEDGPLRNYVLQPYTLNAAEFGVPQARRRAVVIGRHKRVDPLPLLVGELAGTPEKQMTVRRALADVRAKVDPRDTELPDRTFDFMGDIRGAYKTSELHVTRQLRELSVQRIKAIPPGGNRMNIPFQLQSDCWRRHKTGSMDVMGRLHLDRPSVTIRTEFFKPEKGRYLHPTEPRPITHMEAAILQTFPLDYQWCGSKVAIARQIGNAVPVQLANAIARLIANTYG